MNILMDDLEGARQPLVHLVAKLPHICWEGGGKAAATKLHRNQFGCSLQLRRSALPRLLSNLHHAIRHKRANRARDVKEEGRYDVQGGSMKPDDALG